VCSSDLRQNLAHRFGGQSSLLDLPLEIGSDRGDRALESAWHGINKRHVPSVLREHVRDPVAHGARADYRRLSLSHACSSRPQRFATSNAARRASVASTPPSGPNGPPDTQKGCPAW